MRVRARACVGVVCMCLCLLRRPLSKSTKVKDVHGKEMLAIDVISTIIKGIKDETLKQFERRKCGIRERDIQWVLCIPASWHDDARWFWKAATKVRCDVYISNANQNALKVLSICTHNCKDQIT